MKKWKKFLVIFMITLGVFFINLNYLNADSGWDGGYSSDSSSNSDYSDHGSGNSSSFSSENLFAICVGITVISWYISCKNYKRIKKEIMSYPNTKNIKKIILDYNKETYKELLFDIYKKIQIAWMNFDYNELRKLTTDELYNMYYSQLEALKLKKEQNVMTNFEFFNFCITDIERSDDTIAIKVLMAVSCNDYVINIKNNNVVKGNNKHKILYEYEMTFLSGIGTNIEFCPNCHAKLDGNASNKCPYCKSIITNNNHSWVLSKKIVTSQTFK